MSASRAQLPMARPRLRPMWHGCSTCCARPATRWWPTCSQCRSPIVRVSWPGCYRRFSRYHPQRHRPSAPSLPAPAHQPQPRLLSLPAVTGIRPVALGHHFRQCPLDVCRHAKPEQIPQPLLFGTGHHRLDTPRHKSLIGTSRPDANHAGHGCEVSRSQGRPTIRRKHDGREPAAIQVLARGW
jgi:hypothetical protein